MDTLLKAADLERALYAVLPPEHQDQAAALANALVTRRLDPALRPALRSLAGNEVESKGALITFGSGNNFGDVSIGDVVGGDKITISLQMPSSQLTPQEQRRRRAMIQKVRAIWIDGMLRRSLAHVVQIELGLHDISDAVQLPLNAQYQDEHHTPRDLPHGMQILDVFDYSGGALLVLGEPGAGKTTMLLELCHKLLERAENDETAPIPVFLQLTSWKTRNAPMVAWIISEIATTYTIPPQLAQRWINEDAFTLLLDGLDEVDEDQRNACVESINHIRSSHLAPMVVSSRTFDYLPLASRLRLHGAIVIEPLSDAQIEHFLKAVGTHTSGLRRALKADQALREVASTPLMLHVLALACADGAFTWRKGTSSAQLRRKIFDRYVVVVLRQRRATDIINARQTLTTLSWMAQNLIMRRLGPFVVELLDPLWLPPGSRYWPIFLLRLTSASLLAIPIGVILGLGLMASSSGERWPIYVVATINSWFAATATMMRPNTAPIAVARLWWTWDIVRQRWQTVALAALLGGVLTTILGVYIGIPSVGLVGTLCGAVQGLYMAGLAPAEFVVMGERYGSLRRSLRSAALAGILTLLIVGITTAIPIALLMTQLFGHPLGLIGGSLLGLLTGLVTGLWQWLDHGGRFVLYHAGLRLILWRTGYLPLRMYRFLDQCATRPLLRAGGGGYFFIHRLLKEHFATMNDGDITRLSAEIEAGGR